jgi:hypothetical protein
MLSKKQLLVAGVEVSTFLNDQSEVWQRSPQQVRVAGTQPWCYVDLCVPHVHNRSSLLKKHELLEELDKHSVDI